MVSTSKLVLFSIVAEGIWKKNPVYINTDNLYINFVSMMLCAIFWLYLR